MITVKTESQLSNGQVRRRYEVTLTDLLGNKHTEILGMFNHDKSNDGSEVEVQFLASKKEQEVEEYKEGIRNDINLFTNDSLWNTREELLIAVLNDALSLPATDPIVYNGIKYLPLVTDEELMHIYGQTKEWVQEARAKATTLLSAKGTMDSYEAVL